MTLIGTIGFSFYNILSHKRLVHVTLKSFISVMKWHCMVIVLSKSRRSVLRGVNRA